MSFTYFDEYLGRLSLSVPFLLQESIQSYSILRFWDPRANTPQQGLHDQIYAIDPILPQDNMLTSPCVVSHFL